MKAYKGIVLSFRVESKRVTKNARYINNSSSSFLLIPTKSLDENAQTCNLPNSYGVPLYSCRLNNIFFFGRVTSEKLSAACRLVAVVPVFIIHKIAWKFRLQENFS